MAYSEDITRYFRCNRLIGQVLTPIVREYMQLTNVPPATVYKTIMQPYCERFRNKLSQKEMSIVQTLSSDNYKHFDITLMYKLARDKHFKMIIMDYPTRKWGAEPLHNEIRIGDDIERMRLSRDHIMHSPTHLVSEREFNNFFNKFVDVARRADAHINTAALLSYEQQLEDIRSCPIDPETTMKLYGALEENKNLKELVQLQRFTVFMDKDVEEYIKEIRRGNEKLDGTKRIKMVLNGLPNPARLAEIINSRREEFAMACKDSLIELDEAFEGSLILHLVVQQRLFQSDRKLHTEIDRFLEILFTVISLKPEFTSNNYILLLHDDSCVADSSSEEEDNLQVEIANKKLVLDLTVQNEAFQTDESIRQNLNSFVEVLVRDINGQQIRTGDDVTAILRLNESNQEDDRSLEIDDQKLDLNLDKQNNDDQMDQSVKQYGNVEASQTEMKNQQISVTRGFKFNDSDQEDDRSLEIDDQKLDLNLDKYIKDDQMDQSVQQHGNVEASQTSMNNQQFAVRSGFKFNDSGSTTSYMSLPLYRYLCQKIVGSEDHVKLTRLINDSKDHLSSLGNMPVFTVGSIGEGLDMKESDVDMMLVDSDIQLSENIQNFYYDSNRIHFSVDTNDVKPGFAYLRLVSRNTQKYYCMCQNVEGQCFLSSALFKHKNLLACPPIICGPLIINSKENIHLQVCLQSKIWISTAMEWITRKHNLWPSSEIKQRIIDHGVLCVPVSNQRILNELLWRISFSVGEKLLIYTFTHTQLLCYALLKILLKDVINQHQECENLLCSYFIKTIIFWISEELSASVWTPDNLIPCFMECFSRLIYCVRYSVCPHYFIQENNLFENEVFETGRKKLLDVLCVLKSYGWRCIYFSTQISQFTLLTPVKFDSRHLDLFVDNIEHLIRSKEFHLLPFGTFVHYMECVHRILFNQSKKIRSIFLHHLTKCCGNIANTYKISSLNGNKNHYKKYKQALCYHVQGTQHDAVSGWLMLASFLYLNKQYIHALHILSYSLTKCTTEKVIPGGKLSHRQRERVYLATFRKLGILRFLRTILLSNMCFPRTSNVIPEELKLIVAYNDGFLPPVVYLHFLRFLCYYHLYDDEQCRQVLLNLKLTIEENFFILGDGFREASNSCFKEAQRLLRDTNQQDMFR